MSAIRALFFVLGIAALSVFLLQPLCPVAHPQMHVGETPSCCHLQGAASDARPLDLLIPTSGELVVPPASFAYLVAATLFLAGATRFARPPAPPRSYYARSSRILR